MNCKLFASVPLCAALLSGCSSAPELTVPSGEWVDVNLPSATPPMQSARPSSYVRPPPPGAVSTAAPPAVVGMPPKAPVILSTDVTSVSPWGTPPAPIVSAVPAAQAAKPAPGAAPVAPTRLPYKPTGTLASDAPKTFATPPVPPVVVAPTSAPKAFKPAPIPKPVWEARVGESLRIVITNWSKRANYTVAWEAEDLDYPIDAPLRFEGTYEEAVAAIFDLYKEADRSFIVDGHRDQSRLNVTEKHAKDKKRPLL